MQFERHDPSQHSIQAFPLHHLYSSCKRRNNLYNLYIIGRYTFYSTPFFNLCPSITWIVLDQYESFTLRHAMFSITLSCVFIKRFYVFEFLCASFGRDGWALFLAGDGGARVRYYGDGTGGWCGSEYFKVSRRNKSFFETRFYFGPSSVCLTC